MKNDKWKSILDSNTPFSQMDLKFSDMPSKIDQSFFMDQNNSETSMSFQTTNLTRQRMMAFKSSINGKDNPSIIAMEKQSFINNKPVEDTKVLTITEGEQKGNNLKAIEAGGTKKNKGNDEGKMSRILQKIGISKKKDEAVMKDNPR